MMLKANGERLWNTLMEMAKVGPGERGGNCRLALTDEDIAGRNSFGNGRRTRDAHFGWTPWATFSHDAQERIRMLLR